MLALLAGLALAHTPHDATLFAALSADGRLLTGIGRSGIWYALESDDGGDDWLISVVERPGEGLRDAAWLADGRAALIARGEGLLIGSGGRWQPAAGIPEGAELEVLRAEPGGRHLLAGGAGLYLSGDGGDRWERVALTDERVTAAAWSPAADGRACVGTLGGRIFCSGDAGLSWALEAELDGEVTDLALTEGGRVYAAGSGLTVLEPDGEARALDLPGPVTAVGAWEDGLVLAGTEDSIWRSEGGRFVRCEEGLEPPDTYNDVQGGHYRRFLRDERGRIWLASYEGLHTSEDGGRSWRQLQTMGPSWHLDVAIPRGGEPLLMSSYGGAGLSALRDDGSWEAPAARSRALYLRFAAASPGYAEDGIAWVGERGNLWVTTDGGGRWVDVTDAGPYVADVEAVAVQSDGRGAALRGDRCPARAAPAPGLRRRGHPAAAHRGGSLAQRERPAARPLRPGGPLGLGCGHRRRRVLRRPARGRGAQRGRGADLGSAAAGGLLPGSRALPRLRGGPPARRGGAGGGLAQHGWR